ncbi:MAG TPA: 1-deoxy-D-xylulose-5-phosphate reductoisomerase [Candidatus Omnitrophota bacterium]|nr:1-deoxy-D-xylulose-5-phosphate reductoisomerase [Candidatus Omnitrophota bacterium]
MRAKNIVILGSTGSIGINTLKVIERYPDRFKVVGLTAYNNFKLLEKQLKRFHPSHVALSQKGQDYFSGNGLARRVNIMDVERDLEELVSLKEVDIVVVAMRGSAALKPFLKAVRCGKRVAPANKEALVVAGDILMKEAARHGAQVIPIDSEQSAIFQCLQGQNRNELKKVYLTASGGTLRDIPKARFDKFSVPDILRHPTWKMGAKITVDSAMLMNKGFEIIEALRLFDLSVDQVEVVLHPESIIHSMVAFKDGSVMAQLGLTDMRLPIQYALTYPQRLESGLRPLDFIELKQLTFRKPDVKKFPSLALAIHVARKGGTLPAVLNAADEEAVEAFLERKLKFTQIYKVVEKIVLRHRPQAHPDLDAIMKADQWAREEARKIIYK